MTLVTARAPAKLNIGLEVLGRRPDGYHEIATIFQTIDLCDDITIEPSNLSHQLTVQSNPSIDGATNLALKAAFALRQFTDNEQGAAIQIAKRIPVAAGLGGGSSDAAVTLRALSIFWGLDLSNQELAQVASSLGSDVPFLVAGGTMIGRGRGEELTQLANTLDRWVVLAVPDARLENKTQTMFRRLTALDFSQDTVIPEIARQIECGVHIDVTSLPNSFTRVIYESSPELRDLAEEFLRVGAPGVAISGAGPTHYTLIEQENEALAIAERLQRRLAGSALVVACRTLAQTPPPVRDNR
jgi:4-diphosphocytidyl-2-C-methyl-D-erythritol kinase